MPYWNELQVTYVVCAISQESRICVRVMRFWPVAIRLHSAVSIDALRCSLSQLRDSSGIGSSLDGSRI